MLLFFLHMCLFQLTDSLVPYYKRVVILFLHNIDEVVVVNYDER